MPVDPSASPQIVDAAAQQAQLTALAQRRQELQYQLQKFEANSQAATGACCGTLVPPGSAWHGIIVPEQHEQQLQRAFYQPRSQGLLTVCSDVIVRMFMLIAPQGVWGRADAQCVAWAAAQCLQPSRKPACWPCQQLKRTPRSPLYKSRLLAASVPC